MQRFCADGIGRQRCAIPGAPPQASDLELHPVIGAMMLHDGQEVTTQRQYDRAKERLALLRIQIVSLMHLIAGRAQPIVL
jgi:hypothetical protein